MKKLILIILCMFLFTGCNDVNNTPKKVTEDFFAKYNNLSDEVLTDLDKKLNEAEVDSEVLEETKELYKKQYKDMKYEILDEKINGDKATVKVKITVYDYAKARDEANDYMDAHNEEFMTDNVLDDIKLEKYVLEKQRETVETKDYEVEIKLEKDNGKWKVQDLDDDVIEKIHGTYSE